MLVGRERERAQIDALIAGALEGRSGSLVLRGEPGIGKSALLDYGEERATGMRVLRTEGVESESELPFSALHELARPILGRIDALPEPQQVALRGALALAAVPAVDPFAVCAATLGLLAAEAERQPLLCLIDDAHWLDSGSAEALAFTCRRLEAEGILILFAARDGATRAFEAPGLPELRLDGLDRAAAVALLVQRSSIRLAEPVIEQVIDLAGGNPLGLIEIPRVLTADQASGRAGLDEPLPVGERVQQAFLQRASSLSDDARWGLLLAAASHSGHIATLSNVVGTAGLEEAESAGLLAIDAERIVFRHPLVRSSVYHAATPARRRAAHAALAGAADEPASRAWHLAAAAVGPQEEVASALEQAGFDARARGAPAVAAAAFERAARLSPDAEPRARRLLAAATGSWLAGRSASASALLDEALATTGDPVLRADVQAERGRVLMWTSSVTAAHELLAAESERVAAVDPARAAVLMASATMPSLMAGRVRESLRTSTQARGLAHAVGGFPLPIVDVLHAGALILSGHERDARPALEEAIALLRAGRLPGTEESVTSLAQALMWLGDYDDARFVFEHVIEAAHREGSFRGLPFALGGRADLDFRTGRFAEAYAGALESVQLARETGQETGSTYSLAILARVEAAQGREADCRAHIERALAIAASYGAASIETYAGCALGLLELGLGRIPEAVGALERVSAFAEEQGLSLVSVIQWVPDLVEAYARAGRVSDAVALTDVFERKAKDVGHPWALATAGRCRGLLLDDDEFARAFERALAHHRDPEAPFERARTELVYGERLRRARRRVEARVHLDAALEIFERLGAAPWAARARAELSASGEALRRPREPGTREELTPQELQVALLVADGKTNREAAAALFLSPKTIEYHLHNVFAKLRVRSRTELARRFAWHEPLLRGA